MKKWVRRCAIIAAACSAACQSSAPRLQHYAVEDGARFDEILQGRLFPSPEEKLRADRSGIELWRAASAGRGAPQDEQLGLWFLSFSGSRDQADAGAHLAWYALNDTRDNLADWFGFKGTKRQALDQLNTLADNGNLEAKFYRACTQRGEKKLGESEFWQTVETLANDGSDEARRRLASEWQLHEAGVPWLKAMAKDGDVVAQCGLGEAYRLGIGVEQSDTEAAYWYLQAAPRERVRRGIVSDDAVTAGRLHLDNRDGSSEPSLASAAFAMAAAQGDPAGLWELYQLYRDSDDKADQRFAADCLRRAALSRSCAEAAEILVREYVARQGKSAEDKLRLGECYDTLFNRSARWRDGTKFERRGTTTVETDTAIALRWYAAAADEGSAEAHYKVGRLYLFHARSMGYDVHDAARHAIERFEQAANGGYIPAQCALGLAHTNWWSLDRLKGPRDPEICVRWLTCAAEAGHATAQWELGNCYAFGYGVPKNKERALHWYWKAARSRSWTEKAEPDYLLDDPDLLLGDEARLDALVRIGRLMTDGAESRERMRWGVECLRVAHADYLDGEAAYLIGEAYANGFGVPRHTYVAASWFRRANRLGWEPALSRLETLKKESQFVTAGGIAIEVGKSDSDRLFGYR